LLRSQKSIVCGDTYVGCDAIPFAATSPILLGDGDAGDSSDNISVKQPESKDGRGFFLRQRTRFIHNYYITGVRPFREIQRKIEAEESPYDEPPSSFDPEYGEPAFLEEWCEAADAAQIVGRSAISLLSGSLKLYFKALEQQLDFRLSEKDKATATNKGFVAAYKNAIGGTYRSRLGELPNSLRNHCGIMEQVPQSRRVIA